MTDLTRISASMVEIVWPALALLPELLQRQRELDLEEADAVGEGVFDGGEAVALAGFGGAADEGAVVVGQPFFHWQALALLEEGEDVALDGLQGELAGAGDGVEGKPIADHLEGAHLGGAFGAFAADALRRCGDAQILPPRCGDVDAMLADIGAHGEHEGFAVAGEFFLADAGNVPHFAHILRELGGHIDEGAVGEDDERRDAGIFGDLPAQDAQGLEEAGVVAFDVFDALRETAASFFLELLVDGDGLFAVEQGFAALGGLCCARWL